MDCVGFDEGSSLRESVGRWLGLCDTDGCTLGLEFGRTTFKDRLKASWSNPALVHAVASNDSFLNKAPVSSSAVPIFTPL